MEEKLKSSDRDEEKEEEERGERGEGSARTYYDVLVSMVSSSLDGVWVWATKNRAARYKFSLTLKKSTSNTGKSIFSHTQMKEQALSFPTVCWSPSSLQAEITAVTMKEEPCK